ncbi:serine hydrolase [Aureibacter tunicatorum]|uniref:CubicO group peptidase (Beta-lactamase class C family) n=1 Tax=Aureibacter tunicatorum TaxID=866807 RepID=A0AAE3XSN9_9BACT|nr:serine hydrolase [Aureibacter tunicatorum]MDR6241171.1 CubicO group peptidase (beta-lactamase class C family) [Aureibacter tunicatorum]BDD03946.1 hypothetical protein AUTU_14290 [Aureibacter tunicatorum]
MKNLFLALPLLFLSFNSIAEKEHNEVKSTDEKLEYILHLADTIRTICNTPGAGIAIVYNNEIIYNKGIGYRDREKELPVTENTMFAIGSCSKAFTGTIAAKLVEKELLNWNDPVIKHVPEFKLKEDYVTKNVMLKDLLTHMTGIGRYDDLWYDKSMSQEEILEQLQYLEFDHSLREKYSYNNLMYMMAGIMEERASGKSWHQLIKEEIFMPLSMNSSVTTYDEFMNYEEKSIGYKPDGVARAPHKNIDVVGAAGSIGSTPKDMAQWVKMFTNKGILNDEIFLKEEQYNYVTSPSSLIDPIKLIGYSIGWAVIYKDGVKILEHQGAIDGQNSHILIIPEKGFGIAIMTNHRSEFKQTIAKYAKNIFVDDDYTRDYKNEARLLSIRQAKMLFDPLFSLFKNGKHRKALDYFYEYKKGVENPAFEETLNAIGYELIGLEKNKAALEVFKLNAIENPEAWNVWDSLGEGYENLEDYENAIINYKKSLEFNPNNTHAKAKIEEFEKTTPKKTKSN